MNKAERIISMFEDKVEVEKINAEADTLMYEGNTLGKLAENTNDKDVLNAISDRMSVIKVKMKELRLQMQLYTENLSITMEDISGEVKDNN